MIKLMLLSSAYRQASQFDAAALVNGENPEKDRSGERSPLADALAAVGIGGNP